MDAPTPREETDRPAELGGQLVFEGFDDPMSRWLVSRILAGDEVRLERDGSWLVGPPAEG